MRAFIKGDPGTVANMMTRVYGSSDLFPDDVMNAYHAYQSVNFVTCHDGFSLKDLVSYNRKHNEANGESNRDGTDRNLSWNCGWEGDADVPQEVAELRKRQVKNFCCLLSMSNGTPMFRAGDEFMHTARGNNNPYNQDNETTWLDGASQQDADVYVMVNAFWQGLTFVVQEGQPEHWRRVVDTGRASPDDVSEPGSAPLLHELRYVVGPRSVVVLLRSR